MRNLTKLACCGAALALMLAVTADVAGQKPGGGPKPVTQACALTGDATGGGNVGITASSSGPLKMDIAAGTQLASTFSVLGPGTYEGLGRVLKRQGRLDFWFDSPADPTCRPIEWGEAPHTTPRSAVMSCCC